MTTIASSLMPQHPDIVTAAFVMIGDEILSGRTEDKNLNFLARELSDCGINLREVRIVADDEKAIIAAIQAVSKKYDYVFTSGGIGPTHDDITSDSVAKAFNDQLIKHEVAAKILTDYYGEENVNEARMKMAFVPSKATLLDNPVSSAPGFRIENVFVMAGVPKIFQAMFFAAKKELRFGKKTKSREIKISLTESVIASDFSDLQKIFPQVVMGSYPGSGMTSLVFRSTDYDALEAAVLKMSELVERIKSGSIIEIK
jgi:molybdenum cofactor synthesis domain-containing protein